jgi:hypothetical protein
MQASRSRRDRVGNFTTKETARRSRNHNKQNSRKKAQKAQNGRYRESTSCGSCVSLRPTRCSEAAAVTAEAELHKSAYQPNHILSDVGAIVV